MPRYEQKHWAKHGLNDDLVQRTICGIILHAELAEMSNKPLTCPSCDEVFEGTMTERIQGMLDHFGVPYSVQEGLIDENENEEEIDFRAVKGNAKLN